MSSNFRIASSCPIVVVALIDLVILIFFLTATMDRYLSTQSPPTSDDVILTPKSFNPKADESKAVDAQAP